MSRFATSLPTCGFLNRFPNRHRHCRLALHCARSTSLMSESHEPRVSLSEIARQMREQRKSNDTSRSHSSSGSVESPMSPSTAESTQSPAQDQLKDPTGLQALASAHRL